MKTQLKTYDDVNAQMHVFFHELGHFVEMRHFVEMSSCLLAPAKDFGCRKPSHGNQVA
jgi:hypothetical protein